MAISWPTMACAVLTLAVGITAKAASDPKGIADVLERPAIAVREPSQAALLGIANAGDSRLVAVGEHGLAVVSDDDGHTWKQGRVPVSVTLTAVQFVDADNGWATGHSGVVLHSTDGGASWTRQLDGAAAAALALASAQELVRHDDGEAAQRLLSAARLLVEDGADKPFLAVRFLDAREGFVVGAYGLAFRTHDGGATWQSWMDRIDNPSGLHLYAISGKGPDMLIAGEQGLLLHSGDGGEHFESLQSPYEGSYFALAGASGGAWLAAGLRGNAAWSQDGREWAMSSLPLRASVSAIHRLTDGALLAADEEGNLVRWRAGEAGAPQAGSGRPVADFAVTAGHDIVAVGLRGVSRIVLAAPATGASQE